MNITLKSQVLGISVINWLIGLAMIVVLAALTVPSYFRYLSRQAYQPIVKTARVYQLAIVSCLKMSNNDVSKCRGGKNGVPANVAPGKGIAPVYSINVNNSVITIAPRPSRHIKATDTYILTPVLDSTGKVTWQVSGGACLTGLVQC